MSRVKIFNSGEVVRDLGLVYFYQLLRKIDENNNLKPQLFRNYVEFDISEEFDLKQAIFNQIVEKELYQGFVRDLSAEKLAEPLLDTLKEGSFATLKEQLETENLPQKTIEKILFKSNKVFFPYLRNSGKFGVNSQSLPNFHHNLKEIIHIFLEGVTKKHERASLYGKGERCSICQERSAPKYDITHKYAIEHIEKIPEKKRVVRRDSKYLYTFQGGQNNSFSNYGKINQLSSICFSCEFLNLCFLLFVKRMRPKFLVLTDDLQQTEFLQHKIQLKQDVYTRQAFVYQVTKNTQSSKVRLYQIVTDANKGIVLQNEEIIDFQKLREQIKLMDIVERYSLPVPNNIPNEMKNYLKTNILNRNYEYVYQFLFKNVLVEDYISYNYALLGEFYKNIEKEGIVMEEIERKRATYRAFGNALNWIDGKVTLAFHLNQLLQNNDREGLLEIFQHIYLSNCRKKTEGDRKLFLPETLTDDILYGSSKECHYYVGQFIQGLFTARNYKTKGEGK